MKASDYIVSFFKSKGIDIVFGYQGGMITHLVDSLFRNSDVKFIQTYHEQSSAIAAEGYARATGKMGVAISTSGPGATNMITGIADAWFDSIPVLYITGQVNTYEYKYNKPVRQLGFQETDVVSLASNITKYATMVDNAEMLPYELEKAFSIATSGRKGPVLLDIPMNIFRADINPEKIKTPVIPSEHTAKPNFVEIKKIIDSSERPIIIAGGGVASSKSEALLSEFLLLNKMPVVCSLMGKGSVNEHTDEFMGMIGSYGNRSANMAVANADLVIALGSRLDTRQTGADINAFTAGGATIIHVDIDANELYHHRIENKINVNIDVRTFIEWALEHTFKTKQNWRQYLNKIKEQYSQQKEIERFVENKSPYQLFDTVNKYAGKTDIFCADIGQNQMWAAQTLKLNGKQKIFTSGGLAPMGYSLPAAVGASFGNPQSAVWSFCGDGGFHMSLQSLMLISQYNLNVKVVVINNESLGMITQFQELYFNNLTAGTTNEGGYCVPSIKDIAKAYSLNYHCLNSDSLKDSNFIEKIFAERNCIIEYKTGYPTRVSPKLEFDKPFFNPSPQLSDTELEASMLIKIKKE